MSDGRDSIKPVRVRTANADLSTRLRYVRTCFSGGGGGWREERDFHPEQLVEWWCRWGMCAFTSAFGFFRGPPGKGRRGRERPLHESANNCHYNVIIIIILVMIGVVIFVARLSLSTFRRRHRRRRHTGP